MTQSCGGHFFLWLALQSLPDMTPKLLSGKESLIVSNVCSRPLSPSFRMNSAFGKTPYREATCRHYLLPHRPQCDLKPECALNEAIAAPLAVRCRGRDAACRSHASCATLCAEVRDFAARRSICEDGDASPHAALHHRGGCRCIYDTCFVRRFVNHSGLYEKHEAVPASARSVQRYQIQQTAQKAFLAPSRGAGRLQRSSFLVYTLRAAPTSSTI